MKIQILIFCILAGSLLFSCNMNVVQQSPDISSLVFQTGDENYSHYRIPALLKTDNHLLAFAEARKHSASDHGNINIVIKRSEDNGKTWGKLIHVLDSPEESVQNPTPVYIKEENKILLLFTKRTDGSDTEFMIRDGSSNGYVGVYSTTSIDDGLTWSAPLEITSQVKMKNWNWYAVGPGGAIIMHSNKLYMGRIIVPANHSTNQGSGNDYLGAHVIYSNDNGQSWSIGATDSEGEGLINPNETTVVEFSDGTLYFNTRNHSSEDTIAHRAYTTSADGGESFVHRFRHEKGLQTPIVHASICRLKDALFFVGPHDKNNRKNLSLWKMFSDSNTWTLAEQLHEGFSAYSSTIVLNDSQIGILYEIEDYKKIVFKTVSISESNQ